MADKQAINSMDYYWLQYGAAGIYVQRAEALLGMVDDVGVRGDLRESFRVTVEHLVFTHNISLDHAEFAGYEALLETMYKTGMIVPALDSGIVGKCGKVGE